MKSDGDPFDEVSGTTGITGAADTNVILKKSQRGQNQGELIITGRDIEEQRLGVEIDSKTLTWKLLDVNQSSWMNQNEQWIIEMFSSESRPILTREIESHLALKGVNGNTVRSLLKRLTDRGILERVNTGMYTLYNKHNNTTCTTQLTTTTAATLATEATGMITGADAKPDVEPHSVGLVAVVDPLLTTQNSIEIQTARQEDKSVTWEDETQLPQVKCRDCKRYQEDDTSCSDPLSWENVKVNPEEERFCTSFKAKWDLFDLNDTNFGGTYIFPDNAENI